MFVCPHCNSKGISFWNKYKASSINPAKCTKCGELSSVSGKLYGNIGIIYQTILFVVLGIAFVKWSLIPLIAYATAFVLSELIINKFAPLIPYTPKEVKNNKIKMIIILILIVLLTILCGVFMESPVSIK